MRVTFERGLAGERHSFTADVRGGRYAGNGLDPPDPPEIEYVSVDGPRGPERWEEFVARLSAALGDRAREDALAGLDEAALEADDDALEASALARCDEGGQECGAGRGADVEARRREVS